MKKSKKLNKIISNIIKENKDVSNDADKLAKKIANKLFELYSINEKPIYIMGHYDD